MNDFHRYEKKYMLTQALYQSLKQDLLPYVYPDTNSDTLMYTIHNIYYDTTGDELLKKSVAKPAYKEKLRLRSYGETTDDSIVFLELKKKLNGFVHKSRTLIRVDDAQQLIEDKLFPLQQDYHNTQVLNEIFFFVQHRHLIPKVMLSYDREAFHAIDDHTLRVTFDHNIEAFNESGIPFHLQDGMVVMEVKTPQSIPMWLTNILSKYHVFSQSFSKVGSAYYEYLIESRKELSSCLNPYLTFPQPASH